MDLKKDDICYAIKIPDGVGKKSGKLTEMCKVVEIRTSTIIAQTVNGGYLFETTCSNLVKDNK